MPGSTLPNTGVVQGSIGNDEGTWGTIVNNALANYDAHNHTPGKGLLITTAALNINADLTFSSLYAPTNLHRVSFASVAALAANNKSLFVSSADNELYWRNNVGTNVKLTSGGALNVAGFAGGIGGDYTAVAAAVNFDDAGLRYTFRKGGGANWARLASGEVRIFETDTTDTVFVGLAAPAALAGSYTVTWPTALPADTRPVNISSTGQVAFGDSHGDVTKVFHPFSIVGLGTEIYNTDYRYNISPRVTVSSLAATELGLPLSGFEVGDRIKSVTFSLFGDGAADLILADVIKADSSTGAAPVSIGSGGPFNNQPASFSDFTVDVTDTTWTATLSMYVRFSGNAAGLEIGNVRVTYDHP